MNNLDHCLGRGILGLPTSLGGIGFFQSSHEEIPDYPDIEMALVGANASSFTGRNLVQFTNETQAAVLGSKEN